MGHTRRNQDSKDLWRTVRVDDLLVRQALVNLKTASPLWKLLVSRNSSNPSISRSSAVSAHSRMQFRLQRVALASVLASRRDQRHCLISKIPTCLQMELKGRRELRNVGLSSSTMLSATSIRLRLVIAWAPPRASELSESSDPLTIYFHAEPIFSASRHL